MFDIDFGLPKHKRFKNEHVIVVRDFLYSQVKSASYFGMIAVNNY